MRRFVAHIRTVILLVFLTISNTTCTEPFEFEEKELENILVIEGNITDEVGTKEILLSRTYITEKKSTEESGAQIQVEDDQGTVYLFEEQEAGRYVSVLEFGALKDRIYTLKLMTSEGKFYSSAPVSLPSAASIKRLEAVRKTVKDVDGVAIMINSVGEDGTSGYFRYTYEETYKILSFFNVSKEFAVVSENPPVLEIIDKTREELICFKTIVSNNIAIDNSTNLTENEVSDFQLRFIERLDKTITNRYSILVNQFSQSREANTFYKKLKEFSSIELLFSQTQPGFVASNVVSESNPDEKVLGFFEITSVSSKRIFFNFRDIFGGNTRYFPDCERFVIRGADLFKVVSEGTFDYSGETLGGAPLLSPIACVDCNVLGSNVVPDFWVE